MNPKNRRNSSGFFSEDFVDPTDVNFFGKLFEIVRASSKFIYIYILYIIEDGELKSL
jgi:hypothetical protein